MAARRHVRRDIDLAALGERALENPQDAAVLHDALLERFPEYAIILREAAADADALQECVEVRVDLDALRLRSRWKRGQPRPSLRPFARQVCGGTEVFVGTGWRTRSVVTFMVEPRWRPRARVFFDGERRVYDPTRDETVAIRERGQWFRPYNARGELVPIPDNEAAALDAALARRVATEIRRRWSNARLRRWLEWNDRNSDYRGASRQEMIDDLMAIVTETRQTPEEIIHASRRMF